MNIMFFKNFFDFQSISVQLDSEPKFYPPQKLPNVEIKLNLFFFKPNRTNQFGPIQ